MLSRLRLQLPTWRRALRRRRRVLLAVVVAALVAALLPSMLPPSTRGIEVVVLDAAIAPGTALTPSHLSTVRVAPELVPPGAVREADQVLGRKALVPLDVGTPLLPGLLEDEGAVAIPAGSVLMVIPVPAALVPHLAAGTRIELLPGDPAAVAAVAIPAQVLEVVPDTGKAPVLSQTGAGTVEVLITLDRNRAQDLASALGGATLVVTVIG